LTTAILTPFVRGKAAQAGGAWRKKLLPVGQINYKGRVLSFTRDYLGGLAEAFRNRAYDQVPFQLAGDENKHTNDVERYGGSITGMDLEDDGLWVTVKPTERGARVLADNPDLGVSARIVEAYDRSDGKFFPKAIQHVLATLDPRIPGLGAWQTVDAANDVDVTYDLSGAEFAGEGKEPGMPELTQEQQDKLAGLLNLDAGKLAALVASMDPGTGDGNPATPPATPPAADADGEELLTDAQLDELVDEALALDAAGLLGEDVPDLVGTGLSVEDQMALELASSTAAENARQLAVINRQLDRERWDAERRRLIGSGTPPFIADLAQPLLEGSGHVVDLAGGSGTVDAGQIVRKILTEYARLGDQLGIGVELGTPMDAPDDGPAGETSRLELVDRARAQMGL
jgi:hypothetical protein